MAIRNGFKPHSVVSINIPNTQISGDWSGCWFQVSNLGQWEAGSKYKA